MKLNREKLFEIYMNKVDEICEVADWKTNFGPKEIVDIISGIVEENLEELKVNNSTKIPESKKSFLVKFSTTTTTVYESAVEDTTKEAIINLPMWHLFTGNEEVIEEYSTEFLILNIKELNGTNN